MRVKVARVQAWERSGTINIKHADRLAHCTYTPLGQLYLDAPREDTLRIRISVSKVRAYGSPTPDLEAYKARHTVKRGLGWLKGWRRVATCYAPYALAAWVFCNWRTLGSG